MSIFAMKLLPLPRLLSSGLLTFSLVSSSLVPNSLATDWPSWRGPNRDGTTKEAVVNEGWSNEGPKALWKAKVGVGYASITIARGNAYTSGNTNKSDIATLWCLDAATGSKKWTREWPSPLKPTMYDGGPNSSPVIDGDRLYTVIKPARVVCLKADSGETIWEKDLATETPAEMSAWGIIGSPVVNDNRLYLAYGRHGTALDKKTGALIWTTGKGQAGWNTPALAKQGKEPVLISFGTNEVAAVRLKDGKPLWGVPFGEGYFCHSADPLVHKDTVYVGSADHGGMVLRFNGEQPVTLWKNRSLGNFMVGSVLRDKHLYGINNCDVKESGAALKCVEWETGKVLWEEKGYGWGSLLAAADNKLVLLSDKGEVTIGRATPKEFKLLSRFQAIGGKCWTPLTLANGRLYVRNSAGDVVCFDVGQPKAG